MAFEQSVWQIWCDRSCSGSPYPKTMQSKILSAVTQAPQLLEHNLPHPCITKAPRDSPFFVLTMGLNRYCSGERSILATLKYLSNIDTGHVDNPERTIGTRSPCRNWSVLLPLMNTSSLSPIIFTSQHLN